MKIKKLFPFILALFFSALSLSSCDMIMIGSKNDSQDNPQNDAQDPPEGGADISEDERDELEKTGRFLKLFNMPLNTQSSNVVSISISNSLAPVAVFDRERGVRIFRDEGKCSVYIPLVCGDGGEFTETGFFYAAFAVHVDALTKFAVAPSDLFIVHFTDGRGQADAASLPSALSNNDSPCLTVYNLPASVSAFNFSAVSVHNQTGAVASCPDQSLIQISPSQSDNKASAKIPLRYSSIDSPFAETGVFFVSFDINVDAETRYTVTTDQKLKIAFINGNAYLDILYMPDDPVPRLAVKGLPINAAKHHVSNVSVYSSSANPVAVCRDYNDIAVVKGADSSSILIPLARQSDGARFQDSGKFAVSFSINIDVDTQVAFARADNLFLSFTEGSADIDVRQYANNFRNSSDPRAGVEISEAERAELEKTGHYLKLSNMPPNTQATNIFSASVANSSTAVAKFGNSSVFIFRDNGSCSVYLPLVYNDDNGDFLDTGFFYVSFTVHVDALTKYVVAPSDRFLVYFTDGRGQADVNALPSTAVVVDSSRELSEKERDDLETTGRFLKLTGLPDNLQAPNVFSASVANSSSSVAILDPLNPVLIYKERSSNTAYIPLVRQDNSEFLETGFFFAAFSIHVDALTMYVVSADDHFTVRFADGRGQTDVSNIPSKAVIVEEPRYLTITSLPPNVSFYSFASVSIRDQKGEIARCDDFSKILISANGGKAEAKIPLLYSKDGLNFTGSGSFYVSFDISVDADTRYTLASGDKVAVRFVSGNGVFDIMNIPPVPFVPVPYLTVKGLPLNAAKHMISDVSVYNIESEVASCSDYGEVISAKENGLLTFLIPLSSSNGGWFLDSGRFAVSFTFNIDVDTKISYSRSDNVILYFTEGSAEFDVNSFFGHFNASLANPDDSSKPVIKAGSSFDVNGHRCTVAGNYAVAAFPPNGSCVLYLYVFYFDGEFFYEFSAAAPVYNQSRKGWYNGSKRALWKMIYLFGPSQFLFKTPVHDNFPHLKTAALTVTNDYAQITDTKTAVKSIDGASNPESDNFTLEPGVYVVEIKGAGGGAGRSYDGASQGGSGGIVREIFTLGSAASFSAFTGSAGGDAPAVSPSGTFNIVTTRNYLTQAGSTTQSTVTFGSPVLTSSNSFIAAVNIYNVSNIHIYSDGPITEYLWADASMSGGGGGGGGSASFLYSSGANGSYFLAAGGGGGGSGGSYLTPGGAGGAGGSCGPGQHHKLKPQNEGFWLHLYLL
ncbi:hypothetical protein R84B8_01799 [Treponema sp. R8-4-B8]